MKRSYLESRRDNVVALYSEGRSQSAIARILDMRRVTVHRDLHYKIQENKVKARTFIEERIPFENEVCRIGLNKVLEKVWDIINNIKTSDRIRLHALSLAKDCYAMRMDLFESKVEIEQTMQLIVQRQEQIQKEIIDSVTNPKYMTAAGEPSDYALSQRKF
jgi:predicted RNA-binding protein